MDIHAIRPASPKAVVRNAIAEESQKGPTQTEAQQSDLATVRVTGKHEVAFSRREMAKRPRIVEEDDTQRVRPTRVGCAHTLEVRPTITIREIESNDLDTAGLRIDLGGRVDEELDAVLFHRP